MILSFSHHSSEATHKCKISGSFHASGVPVPDSSGWAYDQWRRQDLLRGGALTVDFRAGCSSCSMTNSFVTNAVLIERAVSCWHLHQLISQTTPYLDSWLSDLLQSELKLKLLEVEGACAPVPHSWRRHCLWRCAYPLVGNVAQQFALVSRLRSRCPWSY